MSIADDVADELDLITEYKLGVRSGEIPADPNHTLPRIAAEFYRQGALRVLQRASANERTASFRVAAAGLRAGLTAYRAELESSLARTEAILTAVEAFLADAHADVSALPVGEDAPHHRVSLPMEFLATHLAEDLATGKPVNEERFATLADRTLEDGDAELPVWKAMQNAMAAALKAAREPRIADVIPIGTARRHRATRVSA